MPITFNVTFDPNVNNAPAGFKAAVNYALAFYQHAFTNSVTVNITFAWAPLSSGIAAQNDFFFDTFSYSQIRNALIASAKSPDDLTAYATLPVNNPTGHSNSVAEYELTLPQEMALGLGTATGTDLIVTLNSNLSWTFDPNNRAVSGKHDAIGALEHEISEGMFGRFGDLASDGQYSLFDLFRYTSSGVRGLTPGPGFFSIDGTHLLTQFNNPNNGGDAADWLPSIVGDSFGSSYSGVISAVSLVDLKTLDVAGWNRAPATTTDFTGDAFSDLLFRDATSGTFTEWASTAGRFTANAYLNSVNTAWNLAGSGDFNGDSVSDVIWRNTTDGTFTEWQSTGSRLYTKRLCRWHG